MKDKILILTIPCWDNTGSDTITNLFEGYGADNIANIYFKAGIPTSSVSNNYFYISENKIIKSIIFKDISTGWKINKTNISATQNDKNLEDIRFAFWSRHKWWVVFSLREILWILGKWKTKEMIAFVDEFKPTKMFVPIEGYGYFNRIVVYLMNYLQIPVYSYMWDDNFTFRQYPNNPFYLIHRFFLKKNIKKIICNSNKVFVISPKMKTEIDDEYGINSIVLTKGAKANNVIHFSQTPPYRIIYAGKLTLGRYDTILQVIKSIKSFKEELFWFDIYSQTPLTSKEINSLNTNCSKFQGSVPQNELNVLIDKYDIVIIAEALSGKEKSVARLSFSTKTTDSLASGKCVLCICPKDNATYEYLCDNHAAWCASNKEEISNFFDLLAKNPNILEFYAQNANKLIVDNHDIYKIHQLLYKCMEMEVL